MAVASGVFVGHQDGLLHGLVSASVWAVIWAVAQACRPAVDEATDPEPVGSFVALSRSDSGSRSMPALVQIGSVFLIGVDVVAIVRGRGPGAVAALVAACWIGWWVFRFARRDYRVGKQLPLYPVDAIMAASWETQPPAAGQPPAAQPPN